MRTVISTIASQYPASSPPTISFISVNAEELPDISEDYDVTAVPFVVLVRDGQILESVSGSDAMKVRAAVERHAGAGTTASGAGGKSAIPPALSAVPREENAPVTATEGPGGAGGVTAEQAKEVLFARLAELVKAAPVMLFMKGSPSSPQCGFSRQLVAILRERSVKYGFFNILADEDVRQGLKEFAEWPTFPQLWVSGELVGGLDIVCSLLGLVLYGLWVGANDLTSNRSVRNSIMIPASSTRSRRTSPLPLSLRIVHD